MSTNLPVQINYAPVFLGNSAITSNWIGVPPVGVTGIRNIPVFTTGTMGNSIYVSAASGSNTLGDGLSPQTAYRTIEFLTDTNNLFYPSGSTLQDLSGSGNSLTYVTGNGYFPIFGMGKHSTPDPIDGNGYITTFPNFAVDNSVARNSYLSCPGPVYSGISAKSGITIDFAFQTNISGTVFPASANPYTVTYQPVITANNGSGQLEISVVSGSNISFLLNNQRLQTSSVNLQADTWYRCVCKYDIANSGTGKQIWLAPGNEPLQLIASTVATGVTTTMPFLRLMGDGSKELYGCLSRVVVSNVNQPIIPTPVNSSGVLGFYQFQTQPLIETINKPYIVISDSDEYQTEFKMDKWRWDLPSINFSGLYAMDGQTPSISNRRGALPGTFGAGAPLANTQLAIALPTSGLTYYVAKSGNDGTGIVNDPAHPFLTISGCISNGGSSNKIIYIQDSGVYQETITDVTNNAIIANPGATPILKPLGSTSQITIGAANKTWQFKDITFDASVGGSASPIALFGVNPSTTTIYFKNCTIRGYNSVVSATTNIGIFNFSNCNISLCTSFSSTSTNQSITLSNTFWTFLSDVTDNNSYTCSKCTFSLNGNFVFKSINAGNSFWLCNFIGTGSISNLDPDSVGAAALFFLNQYNNCEFNIPTYLNFIEYTVAPANGIGINSFLYKNCLFRNIIGDAIKINPQIDFEASEINNVYIANCWFYDNSLSGFQDSGQSVFALNATFWNNLFLNNISYGVNSVNNGVGSAWAWKYYKMYQNVFLNNTLGTFHNNWSASTTFYLQQLINEEDNPLYVSTVPGAENLSWISTSDDILRNPNGSTRGLVGETSTGPDYDIASLSNSNLTINGLTFTNFGPQSSAGLYLKAGSVSYCDFNNMENYAIKQTSAASAISNCYFNNQKGFDILSAVIGSTISYCESVANQDASLQIMDSNINIRNISTYAAGYGAYAAPGILTNITNSIFSNSGIWDMSTDNTIYYCCAKTIDISRLGYLDPTTSIDLNPLYQSPINGNLYLKSQAANYSFNSPCIGIGSDGQDLGCFITTYTIGSVAWTNINFNSLNGFFPPDRVEKSIALKNLSADLTESGRQIGQFSAYKYRINLSWDENNPMSNELLQQLQTMYICGNPNIQIMNLINNAGQRVQDNNWYSAYIDLGQDLSWAESSEIGFANTQVPTPARTISIVLA